MMQQTVYERPSLVAQVSYEVVPLPEAIPWQVGIQTFLQELDVLVACGRIHADTRNVVCWTLRQALVGVEGDPAE